MSRNHQEGTGIFTLFPNEKAVCDRHTLGMEGKEKQGFAFFLPKPSAKVTSVQINIQSGSKSREHFDLLFIVQLCTHQSDTT